MFKALLLLTFLIPALAFSQDNNSNTNTERSDIQTNKGFGSFSIRGYVQTRYNRLLETNPNLDCEQCQIVG